MEDVPGQRGATMARAKVVQRDHPHRRLVFDSCLLLHPNFTIILTNSPSFLPISHKSAVTKHVWTSTNTWSRPGSQPTNMTRELSTSMHATLLQPRGGRERILVQPRDPPTRVCSLLKLKLNWRRMRAYLVRTFLEFREAKSWFWMWWYASDSKASSTWQVHLKIIWRPKFPFNKRLCKLVSSSQRCL